MRFLFYDGVERERDWGGAHGKFFEEGKTDLYP